ncbi:glycosyltransferase [Chromobacterium sphagni]|uniref:glycosyltransferase n=1 Tax=Chromobacterium sphagni TaxID=1903179 RepID=UPI00130142F8|nr:glycosyltransferase [Chromobacterium sphagni]
MLLLNYNQQHYIIDALNGALAQDYENLEIIITDDCSTDPSFDMISQVCANYSGPHKLILHRNEKNVGGGRNLHIAASLASGELFVCTDGDDISLPNRVSILVKNWLLHDKKPDLLASYLRDMDAEGNVYDVIPVDDLAKYKGIDSWLLGHPGLVGAAQAYTRRLFEEFSGIPCGVRAGDMVLALRAFAAGGAITIPEPLVLYRRGGNSTKRSHFSVEEVIRAFDKNIDNTKIELLHMIEVASRKNASPATLRYFVNLYQKESLTEFMLRGRRSLTEKIKYICGASGVKLGFRARIFMYSAFPNVLKPFFKLKTLLRG